MNLFEAKEILRKNGYTISKNTMNEGIFQSIKDRVRDFKRNKDFKKAEKVHNKNHDSLRSDKDYNGRYNGLDAGTSREDLDNEINSMKKLSAQLKVLFKKFRNIKIKENNITDAVEWITDNIDLDCRLVAFGTQTPSSIENNLKKYIGKYYTDVFQHYYKSYLEEAGAKSIEELIKKYEDNVINGYAGQDKENKARLEKDQEEWIKGAHENESYYRRPRTHLIKEFRDASQNSKKWDDVDTDFTGAKEKAVIKAGNALVKALDEVAIRYEDNDIFVKRYSEDCVQIRAQDNGKVGKSFLQVTFSNRKDDPSIIRYVCTVAVRTKQLLNQLGGKPQEFQTNDIEEVQQWANKYIYKALIAETNDPDTEY